MDQALATARSPLVGKRTFNVEYAPLKWRTVMLWGQAGRIKVIRIGRHRLAQEVTKEAAGSAYKDQGLVFATGTGGPLDLKNLAARHFRPILARPGYRASGSTTYAIRTSPTYFTPASRCRA